MTLEATAILAALDARNMLAFGGIVAATVCLVALAAVFVTSATSWNQVYVATCKCGLDDPIRFGLHSDHIAHDGYRQSYRVHTEKRNGAKKSRRGVLRLPAETSRIGCGGPCHRQSSSRRAGHADVTRNEILAGTHSVTMHALYEAEGVCRVNTLVSFIRACVL